MAGLPTFPTIDVLFNPSGKEQGKISADTLKEIADCIITTSKPAASATIVLKKLSDKTATAIEKHRELIRNLLSITSGKIDTTSPQVDDAYDLLKTAHKSQKWTNGNDILAVLSCSSTKTTTSATTTSTGTTSTAATGGKSVPATVSNDGAVLDAQKKLTEAQDRQQIQRKVLNRVADVVGLEQAHPHASPRVIATLSDALKVARTGAAACGVPFIEQGGIDDSKFIKAAFDEGGALWSFIKDKRAVKQAFDDFTAKRSTEENEDVVEYRTVIAALEGTSSKHEFVQGRFLEYMLLLAAVAPMYMRLAYPEDGAEAVLLADVRKMERKVQTDLASYFKHAWADAEDEEMREDNIALGKEVSVETVLSRFNNIRPPYAKLITLSGINKSTSAPAAGGSKRRRRDATTSSSDSSTSASSSSRSSAAKATKRGGGKKKKSTKGNNKKAAGAGHVSKLKAFNASQDMTTVTAMFPQTTTKIKSADGCTMCAGDHRIFMCSQYGDIMKQVKSKYFVNAIAEKSIRSALIKRAKDADLFA